jgi:hypothetical protein
VKDQIKKKMMIEDKKKKQEEEEQTGLELTLYYLKK